MGVAPPQAATRAQVSLAAVRAAPAAPTARTVVRPAHATCLDGLCPALEVVGELLGNVSMHQQARRCRADLAVGPEDAKLQGMGGGGGGGKVRTQSRVSKAQCAMDTPRAGFWVAPRRPKVPKHGTCGPCERRAP